MTQKAHVPALEPVTRILPETGPLGPERETPPSSAAFFYKTIDDGTTGSSPWVPPSPSAPSTPETAIRGPIPLTNTSTACQQTSRALRARWGVRLCTDLRCSPPAYEELHCKTKRRRTWGTAFLANRRQRPAIRGEEIRRLPGSQWVSARSPKRMASVYRILPSDRHRGGRPADGFSATLRPYCAPSEQ